MKILFFATLFLATNIMAGERIILKDSLTAETEVSRKTVRCSHFGYGMSELKINIASLDGWTLFDHSNIRFGDRSDLPCMSAGACQSFNDEPALSIDDVIQGNERKEKIIIEREVIETRIVTESEAGKVCSRFLTENLKTIIGGVPFTHSRGGAEQTLPLKACHF